MLPPTIRVNYLELKNNCVFDIHFITTYIM